MHWRASRYRHGKGVASAPGRRLQDGSGDNMTISNIYRWIIKGGVPVAWNSGYRKVGAAWEYATGRILSRQANSPRIFRMARA